MSPASKSKPKDKKAGKDPVKVSLKPSGLANVASGGAPVSGYNPLLGKFHTIETTSSGPSLQANGRFQNIDETTDDYSNDNDTLSNNGSWSGESEDHKDKTSSLPLDSDKREKIRQKNERKHQRQKERRAQELHERCNGFLMSRKLEALARQLVSMGFSQERSTMALILNEGKIEESVAWLFESEDTREEHHNLDGGNLKIDISDELDRIADMERRYKCSRQEVERAIVMCEGDLDKASDTLRVQKQDSPSASQKPDEASNGKLPLPNQKIMASTHLQQRRDDKDFNYTKTVATNIEPASKNVQVLRKQQTNKPLVIDKRLTAAAANPMVSYSLPSPLQAAPVPTKEEARYTVHGNELKNLQLGSVKEPVIVMQRPQSVNSKQAYSAATLNSPAIRYSNNAEFVKPNGLSFHEPPNNLSSSNQFYNQLYYQQHQQPQYVPNNIPVDSRGASRENGTWNRRNGLMVASSLGLFAGLGSNGSSGSFSPVDWKNGGSTIQLDYANIDWTLDQTHRIIPNNVNGNDRYMGLSAMGNGGGGFGDGRAVGSSGETSGGGVREWASPFEEKDLFSLPRQFASSPSL